MSQEYGSTKMRIIKKLVQSKIIWEDKTTRRNLADVQKHD